MQKSKAKAQAIEEFKASSEMLDINVKFNQEAFNKGFKLCEDKIANRFLKHDLSFLCEEAPDDEARPSTEATDLPPTEPIPTMSPTTPVPPSSEESTPTGATPNSSTTPRKV